MSRRSSGWSSCRARRTDHSPMGCGTELDESDWESNMKNGLRVLLLSIVGVAVAAGAGFAGEAGTPAYKLAATYKIGGDGGWDYATLHSGELYVTRVTHTMVIDVSTGKVVADIGGQTRSHGVALVPEVRRGFISDGGSGSVLIFDMKTRETLGNGVAGGDPDGTT